MNLVIYSCASGVCSRIDIMLLESLLMEPFLGCSYLIHIILQSIEIDELQQQCCSLLGHVLDKLEALLATDDANILGDQLQVIRNIPTDFPAM